MTEATVIEVDVTVDDGGTGYEEFFRERSTHKKNEYIRIVRVGYVFISVGIVFFLASQLSKAEDPLLLDIMWSLRAFQMLLFALGTTILTTVPADVINVDTALMDKPIGRRIVEAIIAISCIATALYHLLSPPYVFGVIMLLLVLLMLYSLYLPTVDAIETWIISRMPKSFYWHTYSGKFNILLLSFCSVIVGDIWMGVDPDSFNELNEASSRKCEACDYWKSNNAHEDHTGLRLVAGFTALISFLMFTSNILTTYRKNFFDKDDYAMAQLIFNNNLCILMGMFGVNYLFIGS